jgi:hypothetical protein
MERALLAVLILAPAACSPGSGRALRDFPVQTTAERIGAIHASSLPSPYLGGPIAQIDAGEDGAIFATTQPPCQLLRLSTSGEVEWARRGDEGGREPFEGPGLEVSLSGGALLVVDPGARRVRTFATSGEETGDLPLQAAFEAARSSEGTTFVYPGKDGFLIDVFDAELRYASSIVPIPGSPRDVHAASLLLIQDPGGGVFGLWNPTRTLYQIGPGGEIRDAFAIDPPDLASNLERRIHRAAALGRGRGYEATVYAFLDLAADREGNLAVLSLFEEPAGAGPAPTSFAAALYRFTPGGRALQVVRGLGAVSRAAFAPGGEILALDWRANSIVRFRTRTAAAPPD